MSNAVDKHESKKGTNVKARDLRPWFVNDRNFTPGYMPPPDEHAPARVTIEGMERLLDSAAVAGDSAYLGVCFELENQR